VVFGREIILEVKNLSKVYDKEVLHIDHLALRRGRIYGIIGPSGAGKSTLLRLVNLLEPPSGGEIHFLGRPISMNGNVSRTDAARREMTLVFQKPLLFQTSVEENVAFGLKARRFTREEVRARVDILLGKVGMREFAGRHAGTLSGGEAQRVALARAVAFEPALLLLDEPTANLDPSNIELIERLILDLNRETAMTIVMVTHNIFQARRVAREVIFMHEGRVVETGETEKIFTSPEDPRTKAFVEGRMVY
jgi:tungstate transport system ATP-binding protein